MNDSVPAILNIDVREDITVSLPGTNYTVTYPRPRELSILVHSGFAWEQDGRTSITPSEFLNRAHDILKQEAPPGAGSKSRRGVGFCRRPFYSSLQLKQ